MAQLDKWPSFYIKLLMEVEFFAGCRANYKILFSGFSGFFSPLSKTNNFDFQIDLGSKPLLSVHNMYYQSRLVTYH